MLTVGVAGAVAAALAPLHAQDADSVYAALSQSLRQQERYVPRMAPRPPRNFYSPYALDHRFSRRPSRSVREKKRDRERIETVKPVPKEAPKLAQISSNPHLALMADPTLRPGDIVMFPDGPRVFHGEPGDRHAMSDFVPFAKSKGLSKADRKYLTALRTGVNEAWVETSDGTKVARNTRDVETTGSVSKKRNRP
jgi:hypothetical protein